MMVRGDTDLVRFVSCHISSMSRSEDEPLSLSNAESSSRGKKEQESKNEASEDAHEKKLQRLGSATPQKCPEDLDLDELGREIGAENYQVISLLGVGSQGRVYLVRLTSTDQYFALKVFRKDKILPNEKVGSLAAMEEIFLPASYFSRLFLVSYHAGTLPE